jgi:glycosyltransferase involved in cell wall biosynthesis
MPRFSIVITSFNAAKFIGSAVDSALNQAGRENEVIVVDDVSSDGSVKILEEYGPAIKLIALKVNGGGSAARNLGAEQAHGEYLVFLDGDDLLLPWALEAYGRIIDQKRPELILGAMVYFQDALPAAVQSLRPREISLVEYASFMKKDRPYRASASSIVISRASFRSAGGFSQEAFPLEDADLMLRAGYCGRTIGIMAPATSAYRVHANNFSRRIQRLIDGVHRLLRVERAGQYPGGQAGRTDRYAVLGGIVFYWLRRTWRERRCREFLKLFAAGWPMVLTAVGRRGLAVVRGRRSIERLPMAG